MTIKAKITDKVGKKGRTSKTRHQRAGTCTTEAEPAAVLPLYWMFSRMHRPSPYIIWSGNRRHIVMHFALEGQLQQVTSKASMHACSNAASAFPCAGWTAGQGQAGVQTPPTSIDTATTATTTSSRTISSRDPKAPDCELAWRRGLKGGGSLDTWSRSHETGRAGRLAPIMMNGCHGVTRLADQESTRGLTMSDPTGLELYRLRPSTLAGQEEEIRNPAT